MVYGHGVVLFFLPTSQGDNQFPAEPVNNHQLAMALQHEEYFGQGAAEKVERPQAFGRGLCWQCISFSVHLLLFQASMLTPYVVKLRNPPCPISLQGQHGGAFCGILPLPPM